METQRAAWLALSVVLVVGGCRDAAPETKPPEVAQRESALFGESILGPEREPVTPVKLNATSSRQLDAVAVARSSSGYAVFWNEEEDAYGLKVSSTGEPSDDLPKSLPFSPHGQPIAAATDGTDFLVCVGGHSFLECGRLSGENLSAMDEKPLRLGVTNIQRIAIAYHSRAYLVVWDDLTPTGERRVLSVRVASDGSLVDPESRVISQSASEPAVLATPTAFFVAYRDWSNFPADAGDIRARRIVPATGALVDSTPLPIATGAGTQRLPSLGTAGAHIAVNYVSSGQVNGTEVVTVNGMLVDRASGQVSSGERAIGQTDYGVETGAALLSSTDGVLSCFPSRQRGVGRLACRRISAEGGAISEAKEISVSSTSTTTVAASDGTHALVLWREGSLTSIIKHRLVALSDAAPIGPVWSLSMSANAQYGGIIAGDTSQLALWFDAGVTNRLLAARVDAVSGAVLDQSPIQVPAPSDLQSCTTAYAAGTFLTACGVGGGSPRLVSVRIRAEDGSILDPSPIQLDVKSDSTPYGGLTIGTNGSMFLVAWRRADNVMVGRRVSAATGRSLDAEPLVLNSMGISAFLQHQIVSDGTDFYLVWVERRSGICDVFVNHIRASDGQAVSGRERKLTSIAARIPVMRAFALGTELVLVVGVEQGSSDRVRHAKVTIPFSTLTAADPTGTPLASGLYETMSAATDGKSIIVAGHVESLPLHDVMSIAPRLLAFEPDGSPIAPTEGTVVTPFSSYSPPLIACGPPRGNGRGRCLVAYTRKYLGVDRLRYRQLSLNHAPVAGDLALTTAEDTPKAITLPGTDADGDALTWTVGTPANGTITGTGRNLMFNPKPNFSGQEKLTYTVTDGDESASGTITIDITAVNDLPVANSVSLAATEDTAATVALGASDVDDAALTFAVTQPQHGTVTLNGAIATYTPEADFAGSDSFTFTASDGKDASAPATVTVSVSAVNDAPRAKTKVVTVREDASVEFDLQAPDPDGPGAPRFDVATPPEHGKLEGDGSSHFRYTPSTNANGSDSFTFTATDGVNRSEPVKVELTITPVNDPPAATADAIVTNEDSPATIALAGADLDGDTLTFAIKTQPAHGVLSGSGATRTYTPAPNYFGPDRFTFAASDGEAEATAEVTIQVIAVNDAPVATAFELHVDRDSKIDFTLSGTDVDGPALSYALGERPAHGRLTGTGAAWSYAPEAGFSGQDSFTWTVSDGTHTTTATTAIVVNHVPGPPSASGRQLFLTEDTSVEVTLEGSANGDAGELTYRIVTPPQHGQLTGTPPALRYAPAPDFFGNDAFEFEVTRGTFKSAPAKIELVVTPVDDVPVVSTQSAAVKAGASVDITIAATDVEGSTLTFALATPPAHGSVTITGNVARYTANAGSSGHDEFSVTAADGTNVSPPVVIGIDVAALPPPPPAESGCASASVSLLSLAALGLLARRRRAS